MDPGRGRDRNRPAPLSRTSPERHLRAAVSPPVPLYPAKRFLRASNPLHHSSNLAWVAKLPCPGMRDDDHSLEPAMAHLQQSPAPRAGHWSRMLLDPNTQLGSGDGSLIRSRSYALPFVVFALGLLFYTKLCPGTYGNGDNSGLAHKHYAKLC